MTAPAAQAAAPTLLDLYLKQLCLPAMARAYPAVVREAAANRHDYLQFLITLCGYEIEHRQRNQLARRLKQAQFPWPKTLDEFDFSAGDREDQVCCSSAGQAEVVWAGAVTAQLARRSSPASH